MSSDRLRSEIESILRGNYRNGLLNVPARNPVLGALGISRVYSREAGEKIPIGPIVYLLEHGLIVWSTIPTYPLSVDIGDALDVYFSSAGYPEGYDSSSRTYPSETYANTTPAIIYNANSDWSMWASFYTGLMRLAVQAKIGCRRSLSEIGIQGVTDYNYAGLIFDPDGNPWRAKIVGDAVYARRLYYSGESLPPLEDHPYNLDLSDQSVIVSLAEHFSRYVTGEDNDINIGTLSYAVGGEPFSWGWKWSYTDSRAAIVLVRDVDGNTNPNWVPGDADPPCEESACFIVDVIWSLEGGSYTPSISESTHTTWTKSRRRNFINNLYIPNGSRTSYTLRRFGSPSNHSSFNVFPGNIAPQYCWFAKSGELIVYTYTQNILTTHTGTFLTNANSNGWVCGMAPGWQRYYTAGTYKTSPTLQGFSCSIRGFDGGLNYESGNGLRKVDWTLSSTGLAVYSGTTQYYQAVSRKGTGCSFGYSGSDSPYRIEVTFARFSGSDKRGSMTCDFAESLIISAYDAEHVILARRMNKAFNLTYDASYSQSNAASPWYQASIQSSRTGPMQGPFLMGSSYNLGDAQSLTYGLGAGYISTTLGSVPRTDTNEVATCDIVGSSGVWPISSISFSTLSGFFPYSTLDDVPVEVHTWARSSFMGVCEGRIHNDEFTSFGYPFEELGLSVFIGGA